MVLTEDLQKILFLTVYSLIVLVSPIYCIINVPADYPTIQEALDNAASYEIVLVQSGVYNENIIMNKMKLGKIP